MFERVSSGIARRSPVIRAAATGALASDAAGRIRAVASRRTPAIHVTSEPSDPGSTARGAPSAYPTAPIREN
jgi:hypothetical protein